MFKRAGRTKLSTSSTNSIFSETNCRKFKTQRVHGVKLAGNHFCKCLISLEPKFNSKRKSTVVDFHVDVDFQCVLNFSH